MAAFERDPYAGYVRVRGLPPGVAAEELIAFFRGYGVPVLGVQLFTGTHECILQLPCMARAQRLLAERGRLVLFGSGLELLPATVVEFFFKRSPGRPRLCWGQRLLSSSGA